MHPLRYTQYIQTHPLQSTLTFIPTLPTPSHSPPPIPSGCRGGAISSSGSTLYLAGPTQFLANNATSGYGGALSLLQSSLILGPDAVNITNNAAGEGSALHLGFSDTTTLTIQPSWSSTSTSTSSTILINNNRCVGKGGTVAWIRGVGSSPVVNAAFFSTKTVNYQRVLFVNNQVITMTYLWIFVHFLALFFKFPFLSLSYLVFSPFITPSLLYAHSTPPPPHPPPPPPLPPPYPLFPISLPSPTHLTPSLTLFPSPRHFLVDKELLRLPLPYPPSIPPTPLHLSPRT